MAELMGAADRDVTRLTTTPTSAQRSGAVQREAATGGSPLRLLMVATRAHPYAGGVETHIAEVGPRLVRSGIDVTLLTTDGVGDLPAAEVTGGVRVLRVRAWSAKPDYALAPGVYRAIIRGSWDVVHCQGFHTPVPPTAMLAARRAGIPYVVSFHSGGHSSSVRHALQRAQLTVLGPLFLAARRLVAVSEFEAELFRRRFPLAAERIMVIRNGCDLPLVPTRLPRAGPGPLILSVGRVERYKGHQRAVRALPHVLAAFPNARLRVLGAGSYEDRLKRLARELGIEARVEVRGVDGADRSELAATLSEAALVTLLSDYESQGIAVLEALALHRPVLVAYNTALKEFADRGQATAIGTAAPPQQVAAAIVDQLTHPLEPDPVELPTWDQCAAQLGDLYRSVCAESESQGEGASRGNLQGSGPPT